MSFFYQISAWVFLIHMFLYAGFYCTRPSDFVATMRILHNIITYLSLRFLLFVFLCGLSIFTGSVFLQIDLNK